MMIKPEDVDAVICLICGIAPKIVCTDGNTKVNLVFQYYYGHSSRAPTKYLPNSD